MPFSIINCNYHRAHYLETKRYSKFYLYLLRLLKLQVYKSKNRKLFYYLLKTTKNYTALSYHKYILLKIQRNEP